MNIKKYIEKQCDYQCKVCPYVDECFTYTMDNAVYKLIDNSDLIDEDIVKIVDDFDG